MADSDRREHDSGENKSVTDLLNANNINAQEIEDLVCLPLKTLEEWRDWPISEHPSWSKKVLRLQPKSKSCWLGKDVKTFVNSGESGPVIRYHGDTVPKTLVCHDYKGGYQEDRYVEGSDKYTEYRFFHWAGVDTFVYFSHYMVTIPPLMWINSAHRHGVKVLGTIITEWKDGMAAWDTILETMDSIAFYTKNLAAICEYFGFDGYLLNVENEIKREDIGKLEWFVRSLRRQLPSHAELIWYDSVTVEGLLKWQNRLNDLNKRFFDACDGIFLNYGWREDDLIKSIALAGARSLDIYVGLDVFGRGVYGGGGFNSDKALSLIRQHNLSVAVFAPGWVHETQPVHHFTSLEYLFWQKLWPHLYVRGPTLLPFDTSFCQGYGLKRYKQGVGEPEPWYNLSLQEYQPTVCSDLDESSLHLSLVQRVALPEALTRGCVQHCLDDGFYGGGCLVVQRPHLLAFNQVQQTGFSRLFVCNFESADELLVSAATKNVLNDDTVLDLVFLVQDLTNGRFRRVTLTQTGSLKEAENVVTAMEAEDVVNLLRERDLKINPYGNNGWKQTFYKIKLKFSRIVEIGTEIRGTSSSILLGNLRILPL